MASFPFISVITVSYNSANFISETITSVLSQTYQNFEYIICDDNSTDDTWSIIQTYTSEKIRLFRNESNIGEYANRNKAVEKAKGRYLIFIDGDDVMYPHALDVFSSYALQFPDCAILIAKDWDHRILCPYKVNPGLFFKFEFFGASLMGNFTKLLFKTDVLQRELFPKFVKTGDSYMQLKIAQNHNILIIPDGLTWWRRRSGNATSNLFSNFRYNAEVTNYKLHLLDANCPLNQSELEDAKMNIFGIHLRLIVRLLLRGHMGDAFFLSRSVKVPRRYFKSFFIPRKSGFYSNIDADRPLHSPTSSRT